MPLYGIWSALTVNHMSQDQSPKINKIKERVQEEVGDTAKAVSSQWRSLAAGGVGGIFAVIVGHPFDLVKVRLQTSQPGIHSNAIDVVKKIVAKNGLRGLYVGVTAPLTGVTPMFMISFWGYDLGKSLVRKTYGMQQEETLSIGRTSAAGFFSAIPMTLVTAPFERVKVLLQIQGQAKEQRYKNGFDVVKQLYKEGGVRSVFRGSFATLARDGPGSAAYFATYEILKKKLTPENSTELSLPAILTAGGAAGVAMWVSIYPVDTVKSTLQAEAGNITLPSVIRTLYARNGIKSFFPGIGPALARAVPANAATFLGVELAHSAMHKLLD